MMRDDESQGPVIRDRRRIDPTTGQVRDVGESGPQRGPAPGGGQHKPGKHSVSTPGSGTASGATASGPTGSGAGGRAGDERARATQAGKDNGSQDDKASQLTTKLAERTADLQRLQAEYANYRKRVERDRLAVREQALANVLNELLPVLDDIGRARDHGELSGGFKSVAESLEGIAVKLGLTSYGEVGDPFDPMLHEALMHSYSADVSEPTCVQILQPGYKVGERIIRPARVAVAEPSDDGPMVDAGAAEARSAGTASADAGAAEAQTAGAETGPAGAASSDQADQQERPQDGGPAGGHDGNSADGPADAGV